MRDPLSWLCGTKPDRKVGPVFIRVLALWGPRHRGLSPPPQQKQMQAGMVRWLLCGFLLCRSLSLPPPHRIPEEQQTDMEKVFSEFVLEISIHNQTCSSFAVNFCCSLGLRRIPWVQVVGYETPANSASSVNQAGVRKGCGSLQIFLPL